MRRGFVGLGNIGKPMAARLVAAGFESQVFDLREDVAKELVEAGATLADNPRELATQCEQIGVCVRDDAQVRSVLLADDGLLAGAERGSAIALHSTILPSTVRELGRAAAECGVELVDAPITGGAAGAQAGTLTYMVGGDEAVVQRLKPMFEASAARIVYTGELGSGAATKLCNNLMTYLGFAAAYEANLLASRSGLSIESLDEVTRANGNLTDQMRLFLALHRTDSDRSAPGFQGMLRSFVELAEKDLAVTLEFARENGVTLPATGLCQQIMARVYGLEDEDRR